MKKFNKIYPPYKNKGEIIIHNVDFVLECIKQSHNIKEFGEIKIDFSNAVVSQNKKFGIVLRVDFLVCDGLDQHVNRIVFWKLQNGEIGRIFGFNIDAPALYERPGRPENGAQLQQREPDCEPQP